MVKIITDSSTMYTIDQGKELGFDVIPLSVAINKKTYVELEEIQSKEFLELIQEGGIPTSSQPPIGKIVEAYEKYPEEDIIAIFMCDGLSGTYASGLSAAHMVDHTHHIEVVDSETLCGPHRYLVLRAQQLASEGKTKEEIMKEIEGLRETSKSFLLPQDFNFLKRGGRLTPLAAKLGGLLKIIPIMTQTSDHKRLEKHGIGRTFKAAVGKIVDEMQASGVDDSYVVIISHAGVEAQANDAKTKIRQAYPNIDIEIFELTPAFITQGGPACVAIQWIKKEL